MKKGRFTEEQIIGVLRMHAAGAKAADLCRQHRVRCALPIPASSDRLEYPARLPNPILPTFSPGVARSLRRTGSSQNIWLPRLDT